MQPAALGRALPDGMTGRIYLLAGEPRTEDDALGKRRNAATIDH